jgi:hypothetical protein
MPESCTASVNNSDIKRREDIKKRRSIPCFGEYTIIAISMFVWARKMYGTDDEVVCRANMIFIHELHRIAERIKWIYE